MSGNIGDQTLYRSFTMTQKNLKNVAASIRQRLINKSRQEHKPFAELVQYYAMERFLYRLSHTHYKNKFILKGALMLQAWDAPIGRPTKDIDLLGRFDNEVGTITKVITDICKYHPAIDDGIRYDMDSIEGIRIKEKADYTGVRVRFLAYLTTTRIYMQIDIGFGDEVYPSPEEIIYPTLLDLPAPTLLSYSMETTIAEKFEAMVRLKDLNSRMKDFYDIWLLAQQFNIQGVTLQEAINRTFSQRNTELSLDIVAFNEGFVQIKMIEWKAFQKKLKIENIPHNMQEVIDVLKAFLEPVITASIQKQRFSKIWTPESGWEDR